MISDQLEGRKSEMIEEADVLQQGEEDVESENEKGGIPIMNQFITRYVVTMLLVCIMLSAIFSLGMLFLSKFSNFGTILNTSAYRFKHYP